MVVVGDQAYGDTKEARISPRTKLDEQEPQGDLKLTKFAGLS